MITLVFNILSPTMCLHMDNQTLFFFSQVKHRSIPTTKQEDLVTCMHAGID